MKKIQQDFNGASSGSVKSMSFYRMSDAPPNWAQTDPQQPDYIANKDLAELSIFVDGEEFAQNGKDAREPIEFRSGLNVELVPSTEIYEGKDGNITKNVITIHAASPGDLKRNLIAVNGQMIYSNVNFEGDEDIKLSTVPEKDYVTVKISSTKKDTFRPVKIDGQLILSDNIASGELNLKSGENIKLTAENNSIIISSTNPVANLIPVDNSLIITEVDNNKEIKVAISNAENNSLKINEDGLFVQSYTLDENTINPNKANGLVAVNGTLGLNLSTRQSAGAMSAKDKAIIDSLPSAYVARKYDIADTPVGTLINYYEHEIRIMCPKNAEFKKQSVGADGDANSYYVTFKTYAPNEDAVGYIEHLGDQPDKEILTSFSTDEYGRKYQPTWLPIAKYDETTNTWSYYGANSTSEKYIGWDYRIDWYDANRMVIASDAIRINLANEECHNINRPYYLADYATTTEVVEIKEITSIVEEAYTWGEI